MKPGRKTAIGLVLAAAFMTAPTSGILQLTADSTIASAGATANHRLRFGDGGTSSAAHPTHTRADYVTAVEPMTNVGPYVIVDTGQANCFNNSTQIAAPAAGQRFYGQDAQYSKNQPAYKDNGDGTISDLNTGLMWQKSPDRNSDGVIDCDDKLTYYQAIDSAASCNTGGYSDWRLPTIKELYSLIVFSGADVNPNATSATGCIPFIDTSYFDFGYGDLTAGERIIDAQYASSTLYASTTMGGNRTMFGVNFADGRIKGYPVEQTIGKKYYVQYVRGNTDYGLNQYVDNGDGTVTDNATGLMWMKDDNGAGVLWENALSYAEGLEYAGYTDWRLPGARELQSIVDYTRSPPTTNSGAIDPMFNCTTITNEAGETDYPCYWSSTTHCSGTPTQGASAVYVCFGRAMGYMAQFGGWIDVHGAGAQRSDPKTGNPADFPYGRGPQGDAIRIYNYVRPVRAVVPACLIVGDMAPEGGDCVVDLLDMAALADAWLTSPQAPGWNPKADMAPLPDGDRLVNLVDFTALAENWLRASAVEDNWLRR